MVLKACDYSDPNQVSEASVLAAHPQVSFSEGTLPPVLPEEGEGQASVF